MTSKRRVFSNSVDVMHYNEYAKNKNALVILSTIKQDSNFLANYKNYDELINLSKIYYKHLHCDGLSTPCSREYTTNIYNANNSYINHTSHHLQNDLYPYGMNYTNTKPTMRLNSKLYLDNWLPCNKQCMLYLIDSNCRPICHNDDSDKSSTSDSYKSSSNSSSSNSSSSSSSSSNSSSSSSSSNSNSNNCATSDCTSIANNRPCKTGLCKNTKQLFI